jgi:hypothetical protein
MPEPGISDGGGYGRGKGYGSGWGDGYGDGKGAGWGDGERLSEYERWELGLAVAGLVLSGAFIAWVLFREDSTLAHRLRWAQEQRRQRRAAEAEFRKAVNETLFEAWEAVTSACP